MKLIILKIGGSIITNKEIENSIKWNTVRMLGHEIREALRYLGDIRLILVHGGGSFGHPLAHKFKEKKGRYDADAFTAIRENMNVLASTVTLLFSHLGLKVTHFQSSSIFILNDGKIVKAFLDPITYSLKENIIPILYGDIAVDLSKSYNIISGDSIVAYLADYYDTIKVLYATDVDGVYTENPKINPSAKRIEKITVLKDKETNTYTISANIRSEVLSSVDVTGGIYRKILDLARYVNKNIIAYIFNGLVEGNIFNAIVNKPKKYTLVEVKVK